MNKVEFGMQDKTTNKSRKKYRNRKQQTFLSSVILQDILTYLMK